jgi:hypothetical protein
MAVITFSYWFLLLIVSGIGIIRYKRLTRPFKVLTLSVIISLIITIMSHIVSSRYRNNAPVIHIETITGYIFYSFAYYYLFKSKKIRIMILILIGVMTTFFIVNAILLQPFLKVFPTNIFLSTQALYVIFSLLLYKQMLLYPLKINIFKQSAFWYNTAILFYATTMFVNLGLGNYVAEHHLVDYIIFYFWYFVLYMFFILIGVSFLTDTEEISAANAY